MNSVIEVLLDIGVIFFIVFAAVLFMVLKKKK